MAYNHGGHNNGYVGFVGNDEIFTHRRTPMHFEMDVEEIVEPRVNEPYGPNNHNGHDNGYNNNGHDNQVQQMYYNDHHHNDGRRDYDRNDRYNRGNYVPEQSPFRMDQEEFHEISVPIRLSSTRNVQSVMSTLRRIPGLGCSIYRDVLTVTGSVLSSEVLRHGPNEFLNIVRAVSGDSRACIVRRR